MVITRKSTGKKYYVISKDTSKTIFRVTMTERIIGYNGKVDWYIGDLIDKGYF